MSGLGWIVALAPFAILMALNFSRASVRTTQALYWAFTILFGMSLSTIFFVYTSGSIATTFFATSAAFLSLSLWGYTTKRDLSGFGTFLLMGLVGLIVAMLINAFFPSGPLTLTISVIGVLIFAGLTAYDTQAIKSTYFYVQGSELAAISAVRGALRLYLDFINLFMFLLNFTGDRR